MLLKEQQALAEKRTEDAGPAGTAVAGGGGRSSGPAGSRAAAREGEGEGAASDAAANTTGGSPDAPGADPAEQAPTAVGPPEGPTPETRRASRRTWATAATTTSWHGSSERPR